MNINIVQNLMSYRKRISEEKEAIYDYDTGRRFTYGDLYRRSNKLANYLSKDLGLKKGDCIGFFSPNHPAFFEAFFASYSTGIIISTYNYKLHENELIEIIKKEEPKLIFYDNSVLSKLDNFRDKVDIPHFVTLSDSSLNGDDVYENVIEKTAFEEIDYQFKAEDIQLYLHTGGTTGTPKTALISYRNIFCNCVADLFTNGLSMNDSSFVFLPLFHTSGWNIITLPLLMCGGRIILTRYFETGKALKIINEEQPTVGMAVPAVFKLLAEHPDFKTSRVECYKWLSSGGATVQKSVIQAWWDRGVPVANGYGMTEVGPHNMVFPLVGCTVEKLTKKWNSIGVPMYFNEVRIVDDDGNDVKRGSVGELLFKGPLVFSGYLKDPEETALVINGDWVHTGDMAWQDEDGYYYIAGRKKNMYISGGENIYTTGIESVIGSYPGVSDVCVIGVGDAQWGEVGKAIIVANKDKFDEEDFRLFMKKNLSTIKIPKYLELVEEIPINAAGKRDMKLIKEKFGNV